MEVKANSFIEQIKTKIEQFFANLQLTSHDLIRYVSCFGIGFVSGLVIKRYGKYLIIVMIGIILLLSVLSYFDFIIVNQVKIKTMLGFQASATFDSMVHGLLSQAKTNFLEFGIMLLGCLLGFKFG